MRRASSSLRCMPFPLSVRLRSTQHRDDLGLSTRFDRTMSSVLNQALVAYENERVVGVSTGNEVLAGGVVAAWWRRCGGGMVATWWRPGGGMVAAA